jgi:hypothetical protein
VPIAVERAIIRAYNAVSPPTAVVEVIGAFARLLTVGVAKDVAARGAGYVPNGATGLLVMFDDANPDDAVLVAVWDQAPGGGQAARAYNSANISLANATGTTLGFDSTRYDTGGQVHNNAVNNSRLTCQVAGVYLITAVVEFAPSATGTRSVSIQLNGGLFIGAQIQAAAATSTLPTRVTASSTYYLNAGDYVECRAYQDSGGALNVSAIAAYSPEFMLAMVG